VKREEPIFSGRSSYFS